MKPVIRMALVMLFSTALITTASAGTVTTTKTTTTVTTSKYNCKYNCKTSKHKTKHYKRHRIAHGCTSNTYYPDFADWNQCPNGEYDCYYDLQGITYKQNYYPIMYENNTDYSCLANEGASSCS